MIAYPGVRFACIIGMRIDEVNQAFDTLAKFGPVTLPWGVQLCYQKKQREPFLYTTFPHLPGDTAQ